MGKEKNYLIVTKEKKEEAKKIMSSNQIELCNIAIHSASVSAASEAIIPNPVMKTMPITATQISMVIELGKIFNEKITENEAKCLLEGSASTAADKTIKKLISVETQTISAAVAGGITEALGWTIAVELANKAKKDKEN